MPELSSLGRVFRSTAPVALTETETEYVVRCVKHIFEEHVVLDFSIHNTIADQMLKDVSDALAIQYMYHITYTYAYLITAALSQHQNNIWNTNFINKITVTTSVMMPD